MTGRQFVNAAKGGARRQREPEGKYLIQRYRIDLGRHSRQRQKRPDLGCEIKRTFMPRIIKRPDTHPVTRKHQRFVAGVVQGEGKIAVEFVEAIQPLVAIVMQDDFGVGVGAEMVAARGQRFAQFDVIEDFTVEGNGKIVFDGAHRLRAICNSHNRQPCVGKADIAAQQGSMRIWTTMLKTRRHQRKALVCALGRHVVSIKSGNSAHYSTA